MLNADFLSRFTTHLKEALHKALTFAIQQGRFLVEPGDLVVGMMQEKGSIGAEILMRSHVTCEKAEAQFRGIATGHAPGSSIAPDLSPAVKALLEKCVLIAHQYEHKYVGTEHLLAALLEQPLPDVHAFFEAQGMNITNGKEQVTGILKTTSKFPDLGVAPPEEQGPASPEEMLQGAPEAQGRPGRVGDRKPKALEVFARDLTAPDNAALLDPVIGRDEETDRVIEILCRRLKNNPILLGEPGVGKTAIVEGLAQRIASGNVPDVLQGKRILGVDLALMVAGTMYRGEFEARLKQVVEEAKQDPHVILFIDEIHNIVGAGSTSGSLDAANILKPALARGEIRCIGATTWSEYKKHIEPDAALERRYQPVDVMEPTPAATLEMLRGLKPKYEEHHGVKYEAGALDAAVRFAERYLTDRFFPDKAIDLMDESAARANVRRKASDVVERLRALDIALEAVRSSKDDAVRAGSLTKASKALQEEQRLLAEKKTMEAKLKRERTEEKLTVTAEHIAEVVARQSHVPKSTILANERTQLAGLETRLNKIIFGQEHVIRDVADVLRRARLGLSHPQKPKASFLFVGPSGVGKTALARALAVEIFGREDALVKLDMSEFAESHSVSKLLGSPAGYVGFREGNRLTDVIRRRPHAVLLFDEFEKAHPDVQHLLLQALEDGLISDATGRKISLRQAYIILTSNVGAEFVNKTSIGFGNAANASKFDDLIRSTLKERFRPELLNRIDRISVFRPLEREALREIVRREVDLILARAKDLSTSSVWTVSQEVLDWLISREYKTEEGARSACRIVERELVALLGRAMMTSSAKKRWKITVVKGVLKAVAK
ncbi:MAG: ATP-dependent Clp protease ATP-binding subunit [Patescibacteria group bacterium]